MANNLVTRSAVNKAQEKSYFAQKCNLLSQYFKEKGSFGDISLGMNAKLEPKGPETSKSPATTLNLLPNMENNSAAETLRQKAVASTNVTTADFFPQLMSFGPQNPIEDATNKDDHLRKSSTTVAGESQMTIFYNGKVLVFEDFPADKAKEIMALAGKGSTSNPTGSPVVSSNAPERFQLQPQVPTASLHRFFAKRKDRAAARAPYQLHNAISKAPPKHEEEKNPWIELEEQSSKQLELKL